MAENNRNIRSQTVKFHDHVIEIETVIINDEECLLLEDVQRQFPGVETFRVNNVQRTFVRNAKGKKSKPLRIVACVDKVVEAFEPVVHTARNTDGQLDRLEGKIDRCEGKIDRIDENTQEILCQIRYVMTQMYELHEFTTPRYFFILPAKHSDLKLIDTVQNWFQTHYKLYFLCECSHEPKDMHVAPHEGYSIKKTRDFIVKYAPYLRTTLQIAQALLSAGGLVIPQLGSAAKMVDVVIPSKLKNRKYYEDMEQQLKMVDNLLNKVDNQRNRPDTAMAEKQKSKGAPLQGAELREIQTYLELVDDKRTLGNLYRIVTDDGHVRWVCLEHYDEISFNNELNKYINDFAAMGGKFDRTTKEALVNQANVTTKHVEMMRNALMKGFNIVKLTFQECSISEDDLEKLLDIIINRSSIRSLSMINVRIRNFFGMVRYFCKFMIAEFNNQTLKVRFCNNNEDANVQLLSRFLQQNKVCRNLDFSAIDFVGHESDLRRALEVVPTITGLSADFINSINMLNSILNLKTNALQKLKLTRSLYDSLAVSHFCNMLNKNKTLIELDLMDRIGFKDETFIKNLLDVLREHKPITSLCLHVADVQPSNQKEVFLIESLKKDDFISHLRLSASVISHKLIKALHHSSDERNILSRLEFYDYQMNEDDKTKLQSLYENGTLHQLTFCEQPYWRMFYEKTNESLVRGKTLENYYNMIKKKYR